jgi:uncharacterized protein YndB with AHSA1/START domain
MQQRAVRSFSAYIKATPEQVWQALTDPDQTDRYGYRGRADYDLRPGGAYTHGPSAAMREHGAPDVVLEGEVIEAEAPHRLVQTWHALFGPETSAEPAGRLEIAIEAIQPSVSLVTFTHDTTDAPLTGSITSGEAREFGGGWSWTLSDLKSYLETGRSLED